ncbi:hypothetical protein LguiB_019603 [Lonicera macranthoides]
MVKVSDFGSSKIGPANMSHPHISTAVKGSFGYLDPKAAIIPELPKEQINLPEWARLSYRKGKLEKIIDPRIKNEIAPECLTKFGEVAYSCLRDEGIERPGINDIVWNLEFVLQLQESADKMEQIEDTSEASIDSYAQTSLHGTKPITDDNMFFESTKGSYRAVKPCWARECAYCCGNGRVWVMNWASWPFDRVIHVRVLNEIEWEVQADYAGAMLHMDLRTRRMKLALWH